MDMVTRKDLLKYKAMMVKSNYIIESSYKLSLPEQRLIYMLIAKIKKDDMEFTPYRFTQTGINNILSKHKISYNELSQHIDSLRNKELVIVKETSILKTKWLSSAEYFEDGSIELCFDDKLKPYLLQLKERFTKLSMDRAITFNSNYSCRIYELLKQYEKVGSRSLSIEALRTMFCIEPQEYKLYGDFKRKVLLQAQKEINVEKTDISFDFTEIKTGRKVTSIKFYIKSTVKPIDEVCATKESESTNKEENPVKEIMAIMCESKITALEAKKLNDTANGDIHKIKEKYNLAQNATKIDSVVGWMLKAIKDDYQEPKSQTKTGTFNSYEQRNYDFDNLEKRLLGWDNEETVETTGEEFQQL